MTLRVLAAALALAACVPAEEAPATPEPVQSAPAAEPAQSPQSVVHPGDPYRGYAYARQVCATCHSVTPYDPESPSPTAPTFADILDRMDAADLKIWLQSSHPTMPNYIIAPEAIDDIVAYMLGLKS